MIFEVDVNGWTKLVAEKLLQKRIIAACGNDCSACPRYVAHSFEKSEEELEHTADLWMRIGYRDHVVAIHEISCSGCKPENWCRYRVVRCCEVCTEDEYERLKKAFFEKEKNLSQ